MWNQSYLSRVSNLRWDSNSLNSASGLFSLLRNYLLMKLTSYSIEYSGRRLYQYNEDGFIISVLIVNKIFRITIIQVMKENLFYTWRLLFVSIFFCLYILFKSLILIEIKIDNCLHFTDIIAYHRIIKCHTIAFIIPLLFTSPVPHYLFKGHDILQFTN